MTDADSFAARLRAGAELVGLFQKFAHPQATELLALSDADFAVIDTEHAPFSAADLDACLLAAMAWRFPALVRIASHAAADVLRPLDMGACGIVVPHVSDSEQARRIAAAARYRGGTRGFSPSPRAGRYGTCDSDAHIARSDRETLVIAQIEDAAALDNVAAIAAVPGVDALFVGRADLAVSLGCGWSDPRLDEATRAIAHAARTSGKVCGAVASSPEAAASLRDRGISFFLGGTDQGAMRAGANAQIEACRAPG